MNTRLIASALAVSITALSGPAMAEPLSLMLNWKAGGDHAPIYYALEQGWYAEAGVDLNVVQGNGSGAAAQSLSVGQSDLAIIDTPTALQFMGKGSPIKGIFVAYNDSPYDIYWKKSSGIESAKDLAGKKLGAPAFDAARQMWVPIADAIGIDPDSVEWVNIQPTAKVAALQSGAVSAVPHFYSVHFIYENAFGDDLGYVLLRDLGLNPYGLAYFASDDSLANKHDAIEGMVQVTQKAFAFCLETPEPCADALSSAVSMKSSEAIQQFEYAARVMPGIDNDLAVGEWSADRMADDYTTVDAAYEIEAFDPASAFTNEFIDTSIRYPGK